MTKKEQRLAVFNRYNGHCAYCGQEIKLNGFEIDHIEALYRNDEGGGSDTFENMNPACRKCNRSKSTFTIEKWRKQLYHKVTMLNRDSAAYNMAKRYGLVQETGIVIQFYYERFEKLHLQNVIKCTTCAFDKIGLLNKNCIGCGDDFANYKSK